MDVIKTNFNNAATRSPIDWSNYDTNSVFNDISLGISGI
jgi:hypothetical protein